MRIAIMQPYLFPYVGYYQLVSAVDKFIFLDDVNFIKRGWINRNRITVNGSEFVFSVPCIKVSQNRLICQTAIDASSRFSEKFCDTLRMNYKSAPFFEPTTRLIQEILGSGHRWIHELAEDSVSKVASYIGIDVHFDQSIGRYKNEELKGAQRLIDICRQEGATEYINAPGGSVLYDKATFADAGIALHFIQPRLFEYERGGEDFLAGLSIIDVLMYNDPATVRGKLTNFELT